MSYWTDQARYDGADAALAAAAWVVLSESDAESILTDVDPMVLDGIREPNLSGEFAGDPTPRSVAADAGADVDDVDQVDECADAWEEGRDSVWGKALEATALRTLGRVDEALSIERTNESWVASLWTVADRSYGQAHPA